MKHYLILFTLFILALILSCEKGEEMAKEKEFQYFVEQFADIKIGRYPIPGFQQLSLQEKKMLYYLYEAALCGRDIIWDQNYKYNLKIRHTLDAIVENYQGNRDTDEFKKFMVYTKRVWFSNGIHHHYSTDKILPDFPPEYFRELVKNSPEGNFPLAEGESLDDLVETLTPILFDPQIASKRVSTDTGKDLILNSANNFYEGVTQEEVENYYAHIIDKNDPTPISYGLNSKLVKENGRIKEKVWKIGGMYSPAIEQIVFWLEKAASVAENEQQKKALDLLVEFYRTGDLKIWDDYSIAWLQDTLSRIDVVNGFIETYGDPLSYRGSWEAVVSFRDEEATRRAKTISDYAQWFEDHSPIMDQHKKKEVKGVTAKVITVIALGGDASPSPPIGINLPNATWIRKMFGSKSVTLGNISTAYDKVAEGFGVLEEFCYSREDVERQKTYGELADNLHTDMHEVIGHGSGQINPGVPPPRETLKNYSAVIEETRADLVAYYFIMDPKLIEIGVMPSLEVGKASYERAIRNGMLQQLTRIKLGDKIEQAHMRNRQLIAKWAYELGKAENVIEKKNRDGKTYYVVNDYPKLRQIFGRMLREIQRITSEGDYEAAKNLVEKYAVKIDYDLHKEVLDRYEKLGMAPYTGFIAPQLIPVYENDRIVDVKVEYPMDFTRQMLDFGKEYSFLPVTN
ncbi:MAG: dihydrofolate reductase [Calditrichia bacterium]